MFNFPLIPIDSSTKIVMVDDTNISEGEKVLKLEELKEVIASKLTHINLIIINYKSLFFR